MAAEGPGLGPYSMQAGRDIAAHLGVPVDVSRYDQAHLDRAGFMRRLMGGRPQVLLHRQTPTYGHFVLLHRLPGGALEVFDSQADCGETLAQLLFGEGDSTGLNGPPGWLGAALTLAARREGAPVVFNPAATQTASAQSCLLHTLARAAAPGAEGGAFVKRAHRFFEKWYARHGEGGGRLGPRGV